MSGRTTWHTPRMIAVCVVAVALAFLVQTALLPAVGASAAIPVVFATVVTIGVAFGSRPGVMTGFAAGLLLDLTGVGTLGVGALLGCLTGALAARIRVDRWWLSGVPLAAALTAASALAFTIVNGALAGLPTTAGPALWWLLLGAVLCAALLLPARNWAVRIAR